MAEERVRRALLFQTVMEILRDAGTKVPAESGTGRAAPQGRS